jgi:TRAP-type C4-dicarboxylate transport system permease small subunit
VTVGGIGIERRAGKQSVMDVSPEPKRRAARAFAWIGCIAFAILLGWFFWAFFLNIPS